MNRIGIKQAQQEFSSLITKVTRGEEYIVLDDEKPVARIIPMTDTPTLSMQEAHEKARHLRETINIQDLSIKDLIDEGRP